MSDETPPARSVTVGGLEVAVGGLVGHADAPELAFRVTAIREDDDGVTAVEVTSDLTGEDYEFEVDPPGGYPGLDKLAPPPAKPARRDLFARHDRMARTAFVGFELIGGHRQVEAHTRRWFFARPRDGHRCFHLVAWPGYLVLTGDVGDCLWSRTTDMLEWAARNIDDRHYLMSKTPAQFREKEWASELAEAAADEWLARELEKLVFERRNLGDWREKAEDLRTDHDHLRGAAWNEFEYLQIAQEHDWFYDDPPELRVMPNNYLWCHTALRAALEVLGHLPRNITLPVPPTTEGSTPPPE